MKIEDLNKKIQLKRDERFSNTAEKLKTKVQDLRESERTEVLNSIKSLSENVGKMVNDNTSGMRTLVNYLQYQEAKLKENNDRVSEISLDIAKSIGELIETVDNKPALTRQEVSKMIKDMLGQLAKTLTDDQISTYGRMTKDPKGRVTRIEERFNNATLITNFYYAPDGSFEWSTEVINDEK